MVNDRQWWMTDNGLDNENDRQWEISDKGMTYIRMWQTMEVETMANDRQWGLTDNCEWHAIEHDRQITMMKGKSMRTDNGKWHTRMEDRRWGMIDKVHGKLEIGNVKFYKHFYISDKRPTNDIQWKMNNATSSIGKTYETCSAWLSRLRIADLILLIGSAHLTQGCVMENVHY